MCRSILIAQVWFCFVTKGYNLVALAPRAAPRRSNAVCILIFRLSSDQVKKSIRSDSRREAAALILSYLALIVTHFGTGPGPLRNRFMHVSDYLAAILPQIKTWLMLLVVMKTVAFG